MYCKTGCIHALMRFALLPPLSLLQRAVQYKTLSLMHYVGAEAAVICNHHGLGGAGATGLGKAVIEACNRSSNFKFLYDVNLSIKVRFVKQVDEVSCAKIVACHLQ